MSKKEPKDLKEAQVIPSTQDMLVQMSGIIATEIARLGAKQSNIDKGLGLIGAKQGNELLKAINSIDEQQAKYDRRDAVSKLSDDQLLEVMSKYIADLPEDAKHKLIKQTLLNHPEEPDSEQ